MAIYMYFLGRPRQDSNLRTRFRKPMLYPLSYGGSVSFSIPSLETSTRTTREPRSCIRRIGDVMFEASAVMCAAGEVKGGT
jgi:hypothetical protein